MLLRVNRSAMPKGFTPMEPHKEVTPLASQHTPLAARAVAPDAASAPWVVSRGNSQSPVVPSPTSMSPLLAGDGHSSFELHHEVSSTGLRVLPLNPRHLNHEVCSTAATLLSTIPGKMLCGLPCLLMSSGQVCPGCANVLAPLAVHVACFAVLCLPALPVYNRPITGVACAQAQQPIHAEVKWLGLRMHNMPLPAVKPDCTMTCAGWWDATVYAG